MEAFFFFLFRPAYGNTIPTSICSAFANARRIVSLNAVGYQKIEVPSGYSLYTVTFTDVEGKSFSLQNLSVLNSDGTEVESSDSLVTIQGMTVGGAYDADQVYSWRVYKSVPGWYVGRNMPSVTCKPAQAWCVNNMTGGKLYFQMSGGVEITPVTETIAKGYGLYGNMTPSTIKLQDIEVYTGDALNADDSLVTLQGMTVGGSYDADQVYSWRFYKNVYGWYVGRNMPDVDIQPGQAFCLNNMTSGSITLKFKSPIAPAKAE